MPHSLTIPLEVQKLKLQLVKSKEKQQQAKESAVNIFKLSQVVAQRTSHHEKNTERLKNEYQHYRVYVHSNMHNISRGKNKHK